MRFCKRLLHEEASNSGQIKSYHYVTEQDVAQFHGDKFFELWKIMITQANIQPIKDTQYYFADYQQAYWMAKSQIDYV